MSKLQDILARVPDVKTLTHKEFERHKFDILKAIGNDEVTTNNERNVAKALARHTTKEENK